ncbi:MAG: LLM class flavin-dependent oxidoreductase, partial [Actinomycetota bacterium]|nr:LLM class flavin-dependent oxidoreductase [Actinomycetota bacterium]
VQLYRERCATHGQIPSAVAIRRDVHVGEDEDDAWRVAGPIIDGGYRGFDPSALLVGSPAQVAEQFRGLAALGYTDVIVRPLAGDQAETLACLSRLESVRAAVVED